MTKNTLLAGASAAAFGLILGSVAIAATATVPDTTSSTVTTTAHEDVNSTPTNSGNVTAANQNNTANQTIDGTNNTNVVDANLFGAVAIGNSVSNTVAMSLYGGDTSSNVGSGIGILNFAANQGPLKITATADGDSAGGGYLNLTSGTVDASGNTISAAATLNAATQTVSAAGVPVGLTGAGDVGVLDFNSLGAPGPDLLDSFGNISVANIQRNNTAGVMNGSSAVLGGVTANTVSLNIGNSGATTLQPVVATATENGNTLAASYAGNSATNSVGMNASGAPAYTGSVVVSNLQANLEEGGGISAPFAADNVGSTVSADISQSAAGGSGAGSLLFEGSLQVNDNTISASARNNSAVGTTPGTGNVITLANGLNYASADAQGSGGAISVGFSGFSSAPLQGGLAVLNAQTNGSSSVSPLLNANVQGGVSTTVQNGLTASVSTNGNAITSSTEGNAAYNAISAGGANTASISGSADIASAQIDIGNANSPYASQTTGSVDTSIATGGAAATLTGSTVSQNGNLIAASAFGNDVANALTLAGDQVVTGGATPVAAQLSALRFAGSGANYAADPSATQDNGSTIESVQAVYGPTATASASVTGDVTLAAGYSLALSGDSLSENANTLQAVAAANTGASAITVSGNSFSGSLGVLNGQTNQAPVTAHMVGATVNLVAGTQGGDVDASTLTASNNRLRALGYGNQAVGNTVSVTSGDIAVPGSAGASSTSIAVVGGLGAGLQFDANLTGPTVTAGLAVLNDQANEAGAAGVQVNNIGAGVMIQLPHLISGSGDLNGGSATADSNQITAASIQNLAVNGATLSGGSIGLTAAASHPSVASVANVQELVDNIASYIVLTGDVQVLLNHDAAGATVDASSNAFLSDVEGNTATNSVTATANSLIAPAAGSLGGASYDTGPGVLSNDAALTVTNAQSGATGGLYNVGGISNASVVVSAANDVAASSFSANANSATDTVTDNTATNTIGVTATTLQATSSVQSLQMSDAGYLFGGGPDTVAVSFGAADQSTFTADANTSLVSGVNNTAANTITVSAGSMDAAAGAILSGLQGAHTSGTSGSSTATGDVALQNVQLTTNPTGFVTGFASITISASTVPTTADLITGSHEKADGNTAEVSAQANLATNTVSLAASSPGTGAAATGALVSVQAVQPGAGGQVTSTDFVQAAGLVSSSTVEVSTNSNLALADLNTATNRFTAGGGASLGSGYGLFATANAGSPFSSLTSAVADYAVDNLQYQVGAGTTADAEAVFGNGDTPPTSGSGSTLTVDHSTISFEGNSNSSQSAYNVGDSRLTLNPSATLQATGAVTNAQNTVVGVASSTTGTTVSYAEPNLTDSSVTISGNLSSAVSFGNQGTTGLTASGVTLSRGDTSAGNAVNAATSYINSLQTQALGDYAVANEQSQFGSAVSAINTVTFSQSETIPVTAGGTAATTGSTVTVSNNIAQAAAEENLATNSLTIMATNALNVTSGPTLAAHAATGGLISVQSDPGGPNALATSNAVAQAVGMVSNSTVDISGNTNLALARGGDVTNTVTVTATAEYDSGNTTTSASQGATVSAVDMITSSVSADIALHNVQGMGSGGTVSSSASGAIGNNDTLQAGAQAVSGSTVTITHNQTTAESDVHVASNTIALNAGSALGASAGLNNGQFTAADATALVSGAVSFSEPNATASTVALNANTSTARASGNTASNVLNATASAQYVIPAGLSASAADLGGGNVQAAAQYAVLNSQNSGGSISGTNATTIQLALNSTSGAGAGGTVTGSSLSVSGNSIGSQAAGNVATNAIGLSVLATGTSPAAVSSLQANTGSINATVSSSVASISAGLGTGAGVSGSTMAVVGNTIVARATGNSVVNTIGAK